MADFEQDGVQKDAQGRISVVKHTLEASEGNVKEIRNEIPIGVSGQTIERMPVTEQSEFLVKTGQFVKNIGGRDLCLRVVDIPLQGGKTGRFHCSRMCLSIGGQQGRFCPEHDSRLFHANKPSGIVINSASIPLTEAEEQVVYEKDGKRMVAQLTPGRDLADVVRTVKRGRPAKSQTLPTIKTQTERVPRQKAGSIKLELTLEQLEAEGWENTVLNGLHDALDRLPARSVADMKRVVAIQDRLKGKV